MSLTNAQVQIVVTFVESLFCGTHHPMPFSCIIRSHLLRRDLPCPSWFYDIYSEVILPHSTSNLETTYSLDLNIRRIRRDIPRFHVIMVYMTFVMFIMSMVHIILVVIEASL